MDFEGDREEFSLENRGKVAMLEIEFDLSMLIHSKGIHLEASDRIVYLFVRGLYEICLRLPETIKDYRAVFGRKERVLRLFCSVRAEAEESTSIAAKKVDITIEN